MKKLFLILFLLSSSCFALQDYYQFDTTEKLQQFETLTNQLRCLVCQNQNIAESNAPLAADLREKIYEKINHNETNQEIVNYLVARYGDYILYRPPFNTTTILLWLAPILLLISGISYLFYSIRKKQRD